MAKCGANSGRGLQEVGSIFQKRQQEEIIIRKLMAFGRCIGDIVGTLEIENVSRSVVSDFLQPHGLQPTRLLCTWDPPGKYIGVGSYSLLQGIFPTQGSNPTLLHCRHILYRLSHQGSPCRRVNRIPQCEKRVDKAVPQCDKKQGDQYDVSENNVGP